MSRQQPTPASSAGSLLGCLGGLLLGSLGGSLLLILLSLAMALTTPVESLPVTQAGPDLQLTLSENFLSRFVQNSIPTPVIVDILPGNQFNLTLNTEVNVLGFSKSVQMIGLFSVQLVNQTLRVQLINAQVSGMQLPPELTSSLAKNFPDINQDVDLALTQIAHVLGTPIVVTGLGTTENQIWFAAKESP